MSKSLLKATIFAGCTLMALSGCATITRGTTTAFVVETDPVGASVVTDNGFSCEATPCTFTMPRKDGFNVTVSKPGYKTVTVHVSSQMAGDGKAAMAGNILVGGIIGAAIDGSNGASHDLVPNPLIIKLERESN